MKTTRILITLLGSLALATGMMACVIDDGDTLGTVEGATTGGKYKVTQAPPKVGGMCRVKGGPNDDKVGTYTHDSSGFWCEGGDHEKGTQFGTACSANNGSCESVAPEAT